MMVDGWVVLTYKLFEKLELGWLEKLYPDDVMRLPMGFFSRRKKDLIEEQVRMYVIFERIKENNKCTECEDCSC